MSEAAASRRGWALAAALAVAWAVLPALPALVDGQLIGHGFTDLYPSVWGLWWFAGQQPGLPDVTQALAAPAGMPFYYSSPLHGWLAWPLIPLMGLPAAWNLTLLAARAASVLAAFGAGRAWGLADRGALVAAAVYGCSPFLHGYAVEGIVEGTDGWALALWLWAVGRRKPVAAAIAFALAVLSSWYVAAVAVVLAALIGPRAWIPAAGGLVLASPALWRFLGAFPAGEPLSPELRGAMGTSLSLAAPGWTDGLNPFAKTSWLGLLAPLLALAVVRQRPRIAGALAVCWVLSLGVGPWYALPPFSSLRFPYRFHAGTLACLALLAGLSAQRWSRGGWLAPLIALEGLLLSPIEPVLPGAPAEIPIVYAGLPGPVLLDLPGPVALPPGEVNRSRARARWFLYAQVLHGHATPWAPDFNAVGAVGVEADWLHALRGLDPLDSVAAPMDLSIPPEVGSVVLHRRELRGSLPLARRLLQQDGWSVSGEDGEREAWVRDR